MPRRFAVGNLQRCANSPQNHVALRRALHGQPLMRVFADREGWLCTDDPDQIRARMRERFTMAVGGSAARIGGGCTTNRSAASPGFCAQGNRAVRGEAFFSAVNSLHRDSLQPGRIRVTFAARRDASCRATLPWFRAIGRVSTLTTLHSCGTGRSIRAPSSSYDRKITHLVTDIFPVKIETS